MNSLRITGTLAVIFFVLGANALLALAEASGNSVTIEWDEVNDDRVSYYELHWGTEPGQYESTQQTTSSSIQISDLNAGETYYFAAKACDETGAICSEFSEELSTTITSPAPAVDFTETATSGFTPLIVLFTADTEGDVERYEWDFGDGSGSTAGTAMHLYSRAGTYTVSLTVTGPDGEATKTKTDLIVVSDFGSSPLTESDAASTSNESTLEPSSDETMNDAVEETTAAADSEIAVGFGSHADDGGWNVILDPEGIEYDRFQLDWPEYNSLSGETRLAAGDIDGDGMPEIIVGLGAVNGVADMPGGSFQVLDDDFSPLTWGQVDWPEYNNLNGETWPAVGDLDGDGIAEIVIGLGPGGGGLVQVFQYADGAVVSAGWTQVDWFEYSESHGETRVATGDLDADGVDELVIGFGPSDGAGATAGGNFLIKDEISGLSTEATADNPDYLLSSLDSFGTLTWSDYATDIGETHPATGDIDNDGLAEVVMGLGQGGDGTIEVFDFEPGGYVLPVTSTYLPWPEYNAFSGEVRPAVADLNGDGFAEVIAGLGQGGEGRIEMFENFSTELVHQASLIVGDAAYNIANGETWPTVIQMPAATTMP